MRPFVVSIPATSSAAAPAWPAAAWVLGAFGAALAVDAGGSAACAAPAKRKPAAIIPTTPRIDIRTIEPPCRRLNPGKSVGLFLRLQQPHDPPLALQLPLGALHVRRVRHGRLE